jgi:hypothetical protein
VCSVVVRCIFMVTRLLIVNRFCSKLFFVTGLIWIVGAPRSQAEIEQLFDAALGCGEERFSRWLSAIQCEQRALQKVSEMFVLMVILNDATRC